MAESFKDAHIRCQRPEGLGHTEINHNSLKEIQNYTHV